MSFQIPKFDSSSLDGLASALHGKADEFLSSSKSDTDKAVAAAGTDEEAAAAGGKLEALRNVAHIVKEQAGKGLGNSREYISKVVDQVSTYASDASTTASTQFSGAKEKSIAQLTAAKGAATTHLSTAKETASTHMAGLQTNLNKAIAQGQGQSSVTASDGTTTDRELSQDEPLKFPFNFIAWIVSFCGGKGTTSSTTAASSSESTSKDISIESLQNAAATLTEAFSQQAQETAHTAGEKFESARSSATGEVEAVKEEVSQATAD